MWEVRFNGIVACRIIRKGLADLDAPQKGRVWKWRVDPQTDFVRNYPHARPLFDLTNDTGSFAEMVGEVVLVLSILESEDMAKEYYHSTHSSPTDEADGGC